MRGWRERGETFALEHSVTTPGRKYNSPVLLYIDLAGNWNFRLSGYFRYLISPFCVLIVRLSFPTLPQLDSSLSESMLHVPPRSPPFFGRNGFFLGNSIENTGYIRNRCNATRTNITFDANNWISIEIANIISFEIHSMLLTGLRVF